MSDAQPHGGGQHVRGTNRTAVLTSERNNRTADERLATLTRSTIKQDDMDCTDEFKQDAMRQEVQPAVYIRPCMRQ